MAALQRQESDKPRRSLNPLTQRVWVAALGRYGPPAQVNPWNAYEGTYSDESLVRFALNMRQDWLDKENLYLMSNAIARLARNCKDMKLQELWQHIQGILPGDASLMDCFSADEEGA